MTRKNALENLQLYIKKDSFIKSSKGVEAIMQLDSSKTNLWGIAGLLHNLDEETSNRKQSMSLHGSKSIETTRQEHFENKILYNAISNHYSQNGYKSKTSIEYTLLATNPIRKFIIAIAKGFSRPYGIQFKENENCPNKLSL